MVRLYCQRTGLTLALQDYTDKKTGEMSVLRDLLVGLHGAWSSRSTRCMPKKTAAALVTSGNVYVLQVKGNQRKLRDALAVCHAADPTPTGATHRQCERHDGRQISWQTIVYAADPRWLTDWAGAAGCVVVKTVVGPQTTTQ